MAIVCVGWLSAGGDGVKNAVEGKPSFKVRLKVWANAVDAAGRICRSVECDGCKK